MIVVVYCFHFGLDCPDCRKVELGTICVNTFSLTGHQMFGIAYLTMLCCLTQLIRAYI